jgi:hypothetical protein
VAAGNAIKLSVPEMLQPMSTETWSPARIASYIHEQQAISSQQPRHEERNH